MSSPPSTYDPCIDACIRCFVACERCLKLQFGGRQEQETDFCRRFRECGEICQMCLKAMARESIFSPRICALCGDICEWCAEGCAEVDHEHVQMCAAACRHCAAECRKVVDQAT